LARCQPSNWCCAVCCHSPRRGSPAGAPTRPWPTGCCIIEQRCITGQNGAAWQTDTVAAISEGGADRVEALRQMTQRYIEHMHTNEPVHAWPTGR